jgi:hypothetical protein
MMMANKDDEIMEMIMMIMMAKTLSTMKPDGSRLDRVGHQPRLFLDSSFPLQQPQVDGKKESSTCLAAFPPPC